MSHYDDTDMTGWDLSDRTDMNGLTIHGLCLSHEKPEMKVLPPDLTGVTFIACNLDNVFVPPNNTLINCSNRMFKANPLDGQDWLVDVDGSFLSPLNPVDGGVLLH